MKNVARWIAAVASLAAVLSVFSAAHAAYPERPVRVIVGLAPGGGTDTIARIMTPKLTEVFGQSFVIDNRPSSGGNIAGELLARAQPDGQIGRAHV